MRLILLNSKRNLKESWEEPGEIALGVFAGKASSVWRAGLEKMQHFKSYLCGLLLEGLLTLDVMFLHSNGTHRVLKSTKCPESEDSRF